MLVFSNKTMKNSSNKKKYEFSKNEKLCSEKQINKLFTSGNSFIAYPLRVVFISENASADKKNGIAVLTSISKKKFKRAVKRNRIKRLIKEAYRTNKNIFTQICSEHDIYINIAFIYLDNQINSYEIFEKAILKAGNILKTKIENV